MAESCWVRMLQVGKIGHQAPGVRSSNGAERLDESDTVAYEGPASIANRDEPADGECLASCPTGMQPAGSCTQAALKLRIAVVVEIAPSRFESEGGQARPVHLHKFTKQQSAGGIGYNAAFDHRHDVSKIGVTQALKEGIRIFQFARECRDKPIGGRLLQARAHTELMLPVVLRVHRFTSHTRTPIPLQCGREPGNP